MNATHLSNVKRLAFALAICFYCQGVARAQESQKAEASAAAAAPEGAEEPFVLRTYDVGDLVITIRDYSYDNTSLNEAAPSGRWLGGGGGGGIGGGGFGGGGGGTGGGGGGGFFSVPGQQPADTHSSSTKTPGAIVQLCQVGGGRGTKAKPEGHEETNPGGQVLSGGTSVTMGDLVEVITATVAPDSWASAGGQGDVRTFGTSLIVSQTPKVHDKIVDLLKQIRETSVRRTTLTIDARWLMLTSDEFDSMFGNDSSSPPVADRKSLAAYTRRAGTIRGITNCFSGQLVYLVGGTRRNVVSGYIPVVGAVGSGNGFGGLASASATSQFQFVADIGQGKTREASVGYQPVMTMPNFGALLEIRPTAMGGPKSDVIIELKSTLTAPGSQGVQVAAGAASNDLAPSVDRVAIETQEIATTMRLPFRKPVLIGGMTYVPGASKPNENGKVGESPQLYLVLEIR